MTPNWFCFKWDFGCPAVLRKNALALKMSLRTNSHRSPWKLFSPRLVIRLVLGTMAPNMASFCDVWILNWEMASGFGTVLGAYAPSTV